MADGGTIADLLRDLLAPGTLALIAGVSAGVGAALVKVGNKALEVWREVKTQELVEKRDDRAERQSANQTLGAAMLALSEVKVAILEFKAELSKGNTLNKDQRDRLDKLIMGQQQQVTELRSIGQQSVDIARRSSPPEKT